MVGERVREAIGRNRVAGLSERQVFLRKDVLGAEYDLGIIETVCQTYQEFDAAGESNRFQLGETREQLLPLSVLVTDQLGTKHCQWLRGRAKAGIGEQVGSHSYLK